MDGGPHLGNAKDSEPIAHVEFRYLLPSRARRYCKTATLFRPAASGSSIPSSNKSPPVMVLCSPRTEYVLLLFVMTRQDKSA